MSLTLNTTHGPIKLELNILVAPKACENFLALAASGYYDNCTFHRNIKGFMVQSGDATNTGKGGQSIWGTDFQDEIKTTAKFNARGVLAMANKGPGTNRSQFFITYAKTEHLDGKNTIFGKVIDGEEALQSLEGVSVTSKFKPVNPETSKITSIEIHANPIAEELLRR